MSTQMKIILFPLYAIADILFTLSAVLFSPIIALFVDKYGNLPRWLKWYETPDNPCYGASFWHEKHPSYSMYWLCVTWLIRNPGQGFDQVLQVHVDPFTAVKVRGNIGIDDQVPVMGGWFLITGGGVFQFAAVIPVGSGTIDIGLGWRLDPCAKQYYTPTLGAFIFTPCRWHRN